MYEFNVAIEYGERPINDVAIQCPRCKNIFPINRIFFCGRTKYTKDILGEKFTCDSCGLEFGNRYRGGRARITEVDSVAKLLVECT